MLVALVVAALVTTINDGADVAGLAEVFMIEKWNSFLELGLKAISFFALIFTLLGFVIVWLYLDENHLASEVVGLLSSPQLLTLVAVFSIVASLFMFANFVFVPVMLTWLKSGSDVKWKRQGDSSFGWFFDCVVVAIPMASFIVDIAVNGSNSNLTFLLFSLSFLLFLLYYKNQCGFESGSSGDSVRYFFIVYFSFFIMALLLVVSVSVIIMICTSRINSEMWQLISIIGFSILYALFVGLSVSSKDIKVQLLIALVAMTIFAVGSYSKVAGKVVSYFNVGSFRLTMVVDNKAVVGIPNIKEYSYDLIKDKDVAILKNVWVVISLSDHVIIKPSKGSSQSYSLSKSAVVAGFTSSDK